MSDDSSDSDFDQPRPSGSRAAKTRAQAAAATKKKPRRFVMRIEFDDDETSTGSSSGSGSGNDEDVGTGFDNDDLEEQPSCSSSAKRSRGRPRKTKMQYPDTEESQDSNEELQRNAARRLRSRRLNVFGLDGSHSEDGASNGNEVTRGTNSRGKILKNFIISEDERADQKQSPPQQKPLEDGGFTSDSSSNEMLEKCPICLLTFRQQEIGSPSTCEHVFCANCIEAWSKNVQTCPIDRLEFDRIVVRRSFENRVIVREIYVDPNRSSKELVLEDEVPEEEVTNCEICDSPEREDVMLLCDSCNQGYHIDCLTPPLVEIPEGSWYCDNCFDSQDEDQDDMVEDLNLLYEDIRDMGIPETRLRVTEVQQPRILRTRQNERIRAAIMRRTRASVARTETTTTTTTTSTSRGRGRPRTSTAATTTTTTTTMRTTRSKGGRKAGRKPRRRRRTRQRTYVVEYDLNNFDEKFAVKTTKKIIRRRKRRQRVSNRRSMRDSLSKSTGARITASKRLAEQLGVKSDPTYSSRMSGAGTGLSIFGNANDLEYFSDMESEVQIESGPGTAVQTSVRISNFAPQRSKSILLGRLQSGPRSAAAVPTPAATSSSDLLSSIMDIQDRWSNAARNLENVHINSDGTLNFGESNRRSERSTNIIPTPGVTPSTEQRQGDRAQPAESGNPAPTNVSPSDITEAPMYPRGGGGNPNFNSSGGGYNNRFNNQSNYRGNASGGSGSAGGGGNQYQRHSTGGMMSSGGGSASGMANNFDMVGRGNFNFSSPNYNPNQNPNPNFSPFSIRFNPRNQQNNQRNNNQRSSLPFNNRFDNNMPQQQQPRNTNFNQPPQNMQSQQQNIQTEDNLFSGLPPPIAPHTNIRSQHVDAQLFSGLPAPLVSAQNQPRGQEQALSAGRVIPPPLMSIPPPPAPPPGVQMPWNASLFQLSTDYGNGDDDSNCPNFSVYSAESQEVAKSTEVRKGNESSTTKEDDENEDLVQLDDDEEIPMPPETSVTTTTTRITIRTSVEKSTDLYEPENPTDELDEQDVEEKEQPEEAAAVELAPEQEVDEDHNDNNNHDKGVTKKVDKTVVQREPEPETISQGASSEGINKSEHEKSEQSDDDTSIVDRKLDDSIAKKNRKNQRSPSSTLSEIKLPENETNVSNRKGVLELYDDSDWEELEIDRPLGLEKGTDAHDADTEEEEEAPRAESRPEPGNETAEPDRSYTPCLDENYEPEEGEPCTPDMSPPANLQHQSALKQQQESAKSGKDEEDTTEVAGIAGMETELISDDDENSRGRNKRRSDKRDKRDRDNGETFKKVSNKQKERNYRTEKQQTNKRNKHHSRSKSKSDSRDRSKSRRSKTKSRSRSRSRSISKSRSRSRSSRGRIRRRSRSPSFRLNNRSHNKENQGWRQMRRGGGFAGPGGFQRRFQPFSQRPRRREIPRYDVRNVIGSQRNFRDRYGRDTSRQQRNSRSLSRGRRAGSITRSRSQSMSPKRNRRDSFSMSPSPFPATGRQSASPRRFKSPRRRSSLPGRASPIRQRSDSPVRLRSRSLTPQMHRMNGRKVTRRLRELSQSPPPMPKSKSRSFSASPRYTPRISQGRSRTPEARPKTKKRKNRERKKKKGKKRVASPSPEPSKRLSRQQDPFEVDKLPKRKRRRSSIAKTPLEEPNWSPSPSPPPQLGYEHDNNMSWTPPLVSPRANTAAEINVYKPDAQRRSGSKSSKRDKRKRQKKRRKGEKRRDGRKEKRRQRRTETPEPVPSKEVFASGNNILVSVSFNKEAANQPQQNTVVTLPAIRDDFISNRHISVDRLTNGSLSKRKKDRAQKRKKLDTKPVAIIDLERSPFQVHQEPADVIVLTDSEDAQDDDGQEYLRERRRSTSIVEDLDHRRTPMSSNARASSQHEKTPPMERLDTILEESYELPQTGPKTPPEPPIIKFNLPPKKQSKVRNPLHDEADMNSENELEEQDEQEQHRQDMDAMHVQSSQKIGPNTPPESGPCSPDAYDPFEPTKSPSISPRSPTPPPLDVSQTSIGDSADGVPTQKLVNEERRLSGERAISGAQLPSSAVGAGGIASQTATLNPVELVMALMNSKANTSQDMANKSNESQFSSSSHIHSAGTGVGAAHDDSLSMREKSDEGNGLMVLSNVLISGGSQSQHIPVISSPTPMPKSTQILKLPMPRLGGSVGSSSGGGLPSAPSNARNGGAEDVFNINDIESPYSPGSADYEDLFEPPPDTSSTKRRSKRGGKAEVFDNLFGSTSPIGNLRLPSYTPSSKKHKAAVNATAGGRKAKVKVGKSTDDHIKVYDDMPNSAVELQVKDKFLRKLNRQERVVEEVKMILKPRFNKKQITKDDYKEIMRRAVPKICHSRSGEINPNKIKALIDAYVKKFRAKHKKLNLINTGQVSSAVKCAAYLKKL